MKSERQTDDGLQRLYARLCSMMQQFETSPPDSDYQRGYRAAVAELREEVLLAMGKPHRRSIC